MHWISRFDDLRLELVGILVILGGASVKRNAQVTSLSWWSTIPRLLPAPQALLQYERRYQLPTADGIVAGAYSGLTTRRINFFAQLLHVRPLDDYQVELVQVTRKATPQEGKVPYYFGPRTHGPIFLTPVLGCLTTAALIALSAHYHDGFSLLAVIMLSIMTSFIGIATHGTLAFKDSTIEAPQQEAITRCDVVIYYPNGAIRVIRPESEQVAQLYFQTEYIQFTIDDMLYRLLALVSTIMFLAGLIFIANASTILQVAFAAEYTLLNGIPWAFSALNPHKFYWQHAYDIEVLPLADTPTSQDQTEGPNNKRKKQRHGRQNDWIPLKRLKRGAKTVGPKSREAEAALWTAITLTGTSQWLNVATNIAPLNPAWKEWLQEAESKAKPRFEDEDDPELYSDRWTVNGARAAGENRPIRIRSWDYETRLTEITQEYATQIGKPIADEVEETDDSARESGDGSRPPTTFLEV